MNTLSLKENESLKNYRVCVVGCGGIGGYVIESLARLGIGQITAVDGDTFDVSNLNRQILSTEETIGESKADTAAARISKVNSEVKIHPVHCFFTKENGYEILRNHDVIVDALDNIETRFILQDLCEELEVPLVHGAIAGWYGQVTTIFPGDRTLDFAYKRSKKQVGIEKKLGNPSFTPALIASIEVSEVLKILIGRGDLIRNKILFINMYDLDFNLVKTQSSKID